MPLTDGTIDQSGAIEWYNRVLPFEEPFADVSPGYGSEYGPDEA